MWLGFSARSIAKGLTEDSEISKDQITQPLWIRVTSLNFIVYVMGNC